MSLSVRAAKVVEFHGLSKKSLEASRLRHQHGFRRIAEEIVQQIVHVFFGLPE